MSGFLEDIRARAAALRHRIVMPEGTDDRTIQAAVRLQGEGLVDPVLLGPVDRIRRRIDEAGGDGGAVEVLDPFHDARRAPFAEEFFRLREHRGMTRGAAEERVLDPLMFGAMLVRRGEAHGSVAGAVNTTGAVLRAAIWCVGPAPGITTVSSAFYMVVKDFRGGGPEVITFTDGAVVPAPDPGQLADIAHAASVARRRLVGDEPRVAFLSYSTRGSADGPSVRAARTALQLFRSRLPEVAADGELQVDAALVADVARRKAADSPVGGSANVLVFPDLDAGNIAYKLVERLAGAEAIGPVVQGLAKPCNDLSRGASVADVVNVACITALLV